KLTRGNTRTHNC
ncbi:adenylate cyclase, class-I family protein, partial [Vibrio parahaemolyticus V-223/04]